MSTLLIRVKFRRFWLDFRLFSDSTLSKHIISAKYGCLAGVIDPCGSSDRGGFVERTFSLVVAIAQFPIHGGRGPRLASAVAVHSYPASPPAPKGP